MQEVCWVLFHELHSYIHKEVKRTRQSKRSQPITHLLCIPRYSDRTFWRRSWPCESCRQLSARSWFPIWGSNLDKAAPWREWMSMQRSVWVFSAADIPRHWGWVDGQLGREPSGVLLDPAQWASSPNLYDTNASPWGQGRGAERLSNLGT